MLTGLRIRNFKLFDDVDLELGQQVVFIGPNNAGKTTALQALALWDIGRARWLEKRGAGAGPAKRSGVAINRRDLIALPVPTANLLWRDLHLRVGRRENGKTRTDNVLIDIAVDGTMGADAPHRWTCGLEFDYANEEAFYCRPLRREDGGRPPARALTAGRAHGRTADRDCATICGMSARQYDWLRQAEADVRHAHHARDHADHEWACFASQQAAEKSLKAVLVSRGEDAWGQTVTALLGLLVSAAEAGEELIECAKTLDKHYIPARYPNGFDAGAPTDFYTKKDSDDAILCAERLIGFARLQIEQSGGR